MICTNCKAIVPDGAGFCGSCGAALTAPAVAPQVSAKKRGLRKGEFLKKEASPAVKTAAVASLVIFLVLAVLIVVATITTNSASILDLPIITAITDESDREVLQHDLNSLADDLEDDDDFLEEIDEEYGSDVAEKTEELLDATGNVAKKISLNNVITWVDVYKDWAEEVDEEIIDYMDMDDLGDDMEEIAEVLSIIRTVTYVFAAVVILFALWAALGKVTGLSILCIFLYVPVCALLSSVLIALICLVGFIALAVTTSRVNKAWKTA